MNAKVAGLFIGQEGAHTSNPTDKIVCDLSGIRGDRHRSPHKPAGVQESHIVNKYRPVANFRQVTIVSAEEVELIGDILGISGIKTQDLIQGLAADMSANILLEGLHNFTRISPRNYLVFANKRRETHAVLRLMGENRPCVVAGESIQKSYPDKKNIASRFVRAAIGMRGQVAVVYAAGVIRVGDEVELVQHKKPIRD